MSPNDIVAGEGGTLMGVWGLFLVPRAWRGYFTRRETRFRGRLLTHGEIGLIWWPFGEVTRRGAIRGFVAIALAWVGAILGYWAIQLSIHGTGSVSHVCRVAAWVFFAWFGVGLALALTVMFFNWPKFIVPPPQRDEPGAVAEWRGKRPHSRRA